MRDEGGVWHRKELMKMNKTCLVPDHDPIVEIGPHAILSIMTRTFLASVKEC